MHDRLVRAVAASTGFDSSDIAGATSVSGGCIHDAWQLKLENGDRFFVKATSGAAEMLVAETEGLRSIAATETVKVPNVVSQGMSDCGHSFLVLEYVVAGSKDRAGQVSLGRSLAELHQFDVGASFGFADDNFLGSSTQPNAWHDRWVEFWVTQRMEHQFRLASDRGLGGEALQSMGRRLVSKLDQVLGSGCQRPSLVHGDLWSGNWFAAEGGAVLFDPAVYYADREAEFGMMTLFGDFTADFYQAYNEVWPLEEGWEDRVSIYRLYHLLNHLNLFGGGYLSGCLEIMQRFV